MKALPALIALGAAGAALARQLRATSVARQAGPHVPVGSDGIARGAEPIRLTGHTSAILILHGFGDTPQSVGALARFLHSRGWTVVAPLLPGHGRSLREFANSHARAWLEAARSEFEALRHSHRSVAVIGQSMGGALATCLAADTESVRALVLLAPYMTMMPKVARIARRHRLVSLFVPYVRSREEASIWDPDARKAALGFGTTPTRLLGELAIVTRRASDVASGVRAPTLMLQSSQDNRIRFADAEHAYAQLGAQVKEFVRLDGCGHVIAVDYCRERVFSECERWLRRFAPPTA